MPRSLHHAALCVGDLDASLRFYRDGLGLDVLMDEGFDGDWPALFDAAGRRLRSVFLGDREVPDAGVVELVAFEGGADEARDAARPACGFFLLSFVVDVESTLARLATLGLGGPPRKVSQPGPAGDVAMATVRDPDAVLVELIQSAPPRP